MTKKELDKYDLLVGFVNDIAEVVTSPDEYLDPNTKDSSTLSIGYSLENGEPVLSDIECDTSKKVIKNILAELLDLVKGCSRIDHSKDWENLRS